MLEGLIVLPPLLDCVVLLQENYLGYNLLSTLTDANDLHFVTSTLHPVLHLILVFFLLVILTFRF